MRRYVCDCGRPVYVRKGRKRQIAGNKHDKCRQCYQRHRDSMREHPQLNRLFDLRQEAHQEAAE